MRYDDETLIYTLKECSNARSILTTGGLDNKLLIKEYACCINWLEDGKEDDTRVVLERAKTFSNEFRIHNLVNNLLISSAPACQKWKKPPRGFVKVNFNVVVAQNRTGDRMVIRVGDGFVIEGGRGFKNEELIRQWPKIYAFVETVKLARTMNISKALFETDYTYLAKRVNKCDSDIIIMGTCIKEIFNSMDMFGFVSICWTSHNCNKVANFICKDAIKDSCN
ncbi:hypothetical protein Golob_005854 [Gossypium lobatum]|uniref:RNase H type-1 domain-containing protein n=1 Tax=Gossypium lobatum TaxID=34289 RepID=A0A7J8MUG2_9ROSI|nr:hypothetical protein [Gossypium lobatum]